MEGSRLSTTVAVYRNYVPASSTEPATIFDTSSFKHSPSGNVTVPVGRRIHVDIVLASHDPVAFPNPTEVDLNRPLDSDLHHGWFPHQCVGMDASMVAMTGDV